jgi:adenylate cyclase class IV/thymidylate kinase
MKDITAVCAPWEFGVPEMPFTQPEMREILAALRDKLDAPCRPSEIASKKALMVLGGMAKAGKDSISVIIEREFRNSKMKVDWTRESAEDERVRRDLLGESFMKQMLHYTVVSEQLFMARYSRDMHFFIRHRLFPDMLYFFTREVREGRYAKKQLEVMRQAIYEIMNRDLVDVYFHLVCSPEAAMDRRRKASLTETVGIRMSEHDFQEAAEIYDGVYNDIRANVERLPPIFTVDTSNIGIEEATAEVVRRLLPALCASHDVRAYKFMLKAPSLLEKEARQKRYFEEQLKLRGRASREKILAAGWVPNGTFEEEDIYLDLAAKGDSGAKVAESLARIRRKHNCESGDVTLTIYYKSMPGDRVFSYRTPLSYEIPEDEAQKAIAEYSVLRRVEKTREKFRRNGGAPEGHYFTLHLDKVKGLGDFTEIRALGTPNITHEKELLELASELGFSLSDVVTGSYCSVA